MNKKLNKKLLNLIALCSGITATVALGVGGVVYSLRQEKNGGDEPVDQKVLPESVYKFSKDGKTLLGFQDAFLNDPTSPIYKDNFKNCDTMEIPAIVTSVADNAFFDIPQSGDPSSTIPSFITRLTFAEGSHCSSIGENAFCFFSSLTSVVFPSELTSIAVGAFNYCPSLTSVNLSNCTNLTKLNGVFSSCNSLTSVVLPNGLTEIGKYAFSGCSKLTSINFPSSLRLIGNEAFYLCSSLDSVNLLECINLSSIFNMCFRNCSALTSVIFSKNLQSIGENAFGDCPNLSSITWDAWTGSFDSLSSDAFSGVCQTGGTVTVTNPSDGHDSDALLNHLLRKGGLPQSWAKDVVNPLPDEVYKFSEDGETLLGFQDAFLNDSASPIYKDNFQNCDTMQIPASVTSIADNAFFNNVSSIFPSFIKNLTFAEGSHCSSIGNTAFQRFPALTSATFPSSLESIGSGAFFQCRDLTVVDLSNCGNLTTFNSAGATFSGCTSLTSVVLPSSFTTIPYLSFEDCSTLTSVNFPSSLAEIGRSAFSGCSSLDSINLSECINLTVINFNAFYNCSALTSVSFPSSLKTLGVSVFTDCNNLRNIIWNAWTGDTTIGQSAFNRVYSEGKVQVTNPKDDAHNSAALLAYLKEKGLPDGWHI